MQNVEEINNLFRKIKAIRETYEISADVCLDTLIGICDASPQMTSVVEFSKYSIAVVHNNENVSRFLGMTQKESVKLGFNFFLKVVHPENLGSLYLIIRFFNDPRNVNRLFTNTYYVKSVNGWEWIYNSMKPVTYNEDGSIKYMLSVSCSLAGQFKSRQQFRHLKKNLDFYEENLEKYLSMTTQEKEVLGLIADELTTEEIAETMSLSPDSVEDISNKLVQLFNVKTTAGLIKYALHFKLV